VQAGRGIAEDEIVRSPGWLPVEPDGGDAMRLVQLDEAAYAAASFLDQRLLTGGYPQQSCALSTLQAAAARLRPPPHYIFHTGHVGSTLISRLLGAHPRFFSLREPALLRAISSGSGAQPQLPVALALLGRTWRPQQRAVVKATSFVSELAEAVLAGVEGPSAVFMFAQPLAYLRGILAGANSRVENRQLAPARLQRLMRRLGPGAVPLELSSEGEAVAMSWLCEMTVLTQAAGRFASQVLWLDFDVFLQEPCAGLAGIFAAFGEAAAAAQLDALLAAPLMRQYSKAPEHAYDAALRRAVLESAEHEHPLEIRRGMQWLARAAARYPLAAAVLGRVAN
jgi:hypothetical protein